MSRDVELDETDGFDVMRDGLKLTVVAATRL